MLQRLTPWPECGICKKPVETTYAMDAQHSNDFTFVAHCHDASCCLTVPAAVVMAGRAIALPPAFTDEEIGGLRWKSFPPST